MIPRRIVLAGGWQAALLACWYVLRPIRDQLGASRGSADLWWLFAGTMAVMLVAHPVQAWAVGRWSRRRVVLGVHGAFATQLLAFAAAAASGVGPWLGPVFFIWTSVFALFVLSLAWSVAADLFSPDEGKRYFAWIAAGATGGAMAGSALTATLAERVGTVGLWVAAAALLSLAAGFGATLLHGADLADPGPAAPGAPLTGVVHVVRDPFLRGIVLWILGLTATATLLYTQQAEFVGGAYPDADARTAVYARIDLAVSVCALVIQLGAARFLLVRLGVGGTLGALPVVSALGFVAVALAPGLTSVVVFQVVRRAADYALARPAREVLFTAVSREDRYKAKHLLDTVVYRTGDQLAVGLDAALRASGLGPAGLAAVAVPIALGWAAGSLRIGRAFEVRGSVAGPRSRSAP